MSAFLTRVVRFSAAHRYHRPEWSEERNAATFGACANPHGHGHNYTLEATFAGGTDPLTGFSVNLAELDALLESRVVAALDHQHINHAVDAFGPGKLIPTSENLAAWIWDRLVGEVKSGRLVRLRLYEDPDLFVDFFGPGTPEGPPSLRIA